VSYFVLFGGYYQEPTNGLSIAAVDVDTWLDTFPPLHVSASHRKAMHETRTGALVGVELMKQFNWHIGDRITLHSILWASNKDGSSDWPVDIVGITLAAPGDDRTFAKEMYLNYDYIDAGRTTRTGTVNQFVVSLAEGADPDAIVPPNVYVAGLAIALLLALLSAAVPAVRAHRLTVVEALSGR
jgi:putative ABC transport system permease protein